MVAAVLSGNRNFEGRVHPKCGPTTWPRRRWSWPTPWPAAWTSTCTTSRWAPTSGKPVYLTDIWPTQQEVQTAIERVGPIGDVPQGIRRGIQGRRALERRCRCRRATCTSGTRSPPTSSTRPISTDMTAEPARCSDIQGARVLAVLGDSITTDHISPAGSIKADSPAGHYLIEHGVEPKDFNSYGSRRGNDEVMVRGTFANVRLQNLLAPGTEGGVTRHLPDGEQMSIFDAAMKYQKEGMPLLVLAGKEYGSGSSRDWAAKGPSSWACARSSPRATSASTAATWSAWASCRLQFQPGENAASLGLTGEEVYDVEGLPSRACRPPRTQSRNQRPSQAGRRRTSRISCPRPDRHAAGSPLLPARRHPAIRPSPVACQEMSRTRHAPVPPVIAVPANFVALRGHHRAVRDGGRIYDKMTGPNGMTIQQYRLLFDYWEILVIRTLEED